MSAKPKIAPYIEQTGRTDGIDWAVTVQASLGHRCGYAKVPAGHTLHGLTESARADRLPALSIDYGSDHDATVSGQLDAHGGVTWAGRAPLEAMGDGWWLGFDCAHSGDAPDPSLPGAYPSEFGEARTLDYVIAECQRLASQIASFTVPNPFDDPEIAALYDALTAWKAGPR